MTAKGKGKDVLREYYKGCKAPVAAGPQDGIDKYCTERCGPEGDLCDIKECPLYAWRPQSVRAVVTKPPEAAE